MLKELLFNDRNIKKINVIITVIYFLLHLLVIFVHEHWFDEAQAWVLAKNLSFFELIRILPTEGHPALWFIFLIPFAKAGLSFYYASFISLFIMSIAVYIYLNKAPFSLLVKCITLLSSVFLFFNPVVVRSYSLIALIIICLAVLYKDRDTKPIIYSILVGLLFQSHVVAFGLAIGLLIDLIIEFIKNKKNKKLLLGIFIIVLSFVLMVLEIMPRSDLPSGIDTSVGGIFSNLKIDILKERLSYFAYTSWGMPIGILSFVPYICLIGCVVLIFVFISKNKTWKDNYQMMIISICGVGEFFAVLLLVYTPHTQMASILVMILLFVLWQFYGMNKDFNLRATCVAMLVFISFFTFIVTQSLLRVDIAGDFSASKAAAEVIENTIEENGILIMDNNDDDVPVYAYASSNRSDINYYDAKNDREFNIHQLGIIYDGIELDHILDIADEKFKNEKNVYYLTNKEIINDRLLLIHKNDKSFYSEKYYIYRIGE